MSDDNQVRVYVRASGPSIEAFDGLAVRPTSLREAAARPPRTANPPVIATYDLPTLDASLPVALDVIPQLDDIAAALRSLDDGPLLRVVPEYEALDVRLAPGLVAQLDRLGVGIDIDPYWRGRPAWAEDARGNFSLCTSVVSGVPAQLPPCPDEEWSARLHAARHRRPRQVTSFGSLNVVFGPGNRVTVAKYGDYDGHMARNLRTAIRAWSKLFHDDEHVTGCEAVQVAIGGTGGPSLSPERRELRSLARLGAGLRIILRPTELDEWTLQGLLGSTAEE